MTFAEKLHMLIDEREITQKKLAQDLQIPASTLGGYVQGTSEPDFDTLKIFARYFNVSSDYLLDIHDNLARSRREEELLRIFRTLTPEQQELYLEQGKVFVRLNARGAETSSSLTSVANGKAV